MTYVENHWFTKTIRVQWEVTFPELQLSHRTGSHSIFQTSQQYSYCKLMSDILQPLSRSSRDVTYSILWHQQDSNCDDANKRPHTWLRHEHLCVIVRQALVQVHHFVHDLSNIILRQTSLKRGNRLVAVKTPHLPAVWYLRTSGGHRIALARRGIVMVFVLCDVRIVFDGRLTVVWWWRRCRYARVSR